MLASLLLYYTVANEDLADLDQLWTPTLHFYSTYPLAEVLLRFYLNLQCAHCIAQVVPIAQQLLVGLGHPKFTGARTKYKSRCFC